MKRNAFLWSLFAAMSLIPCGEMTAAVQDNGKTVYNFPFAPSEGVVNQSEKDFRQEICLNGYWQFQPVAIPADYKQGGGKAPELPMPEKGTWSDTRIKIPSPWNINSFAYRGLEGPDHRNYPSYPKEWENVLMGWLKKTVKVPADWNGEEIKLYFEAVAGEAVVYVNGKEVGRNFDLFLPFTCDITNAVVPGQDAEILVGVRSQKLFEDNSTVGRRIVPAGSMWGYHINGIWQDVYLLAQPKVSVTDVYVKPLVSQDLLRIETEITNNTEKPVEVTLGGDVKEWINLAGTDVNSAPVPASKLGETALSLPSQKVKIAAGATVKATIDANVGDALRFWTPEHPNLYGLVLTLGNKKGTIDKKYERFGWREWSLQGTTQCLNGKPYALRSDSWHFQGIPQMTRRYAWSWFKAIKDMNGNAVRPHAQVYPRFYLDMADEMGICVLDETANWASDGGPKLDSDLFWENSIDHLSRFVKRDRNHASVFGWSVSNENKPVILYVFNRPDLLPRQKEEWKNWRDKVRELDPTRPWISADGEDDGDGILPVTVGHYGDKNSMKNWKAIGKPWGMGEHSMAYYGTPEQVAVYNGERAYESQEGRMEGLANECYNLIKDQRDMGASFSTIFNMAWYGLKPLPLGKKDITTAPAPEDGIFFGEYVEGVPGVQPERVGPYCTTFNPGYDPNLPLYEEWPLFAALRAANAPGQPAYSEWAVVDKQEYEAPAAIPAAESYKEVVFVGAPDSHAKATLDAQGIVWANGIKSPASALIIADGSAPLSQKDSKTVATALAKGADLWVWDITPEAAASFNAIFPYELKVENLSRSSYIPQQRSWIRGLNNSDFYFCELQKADASTHSLSGNFVDEGEVMLNACRTDWRKWNKRPEELKTAGTLRSENECTAALPVFVKLSEGNGDIYVSTLSEFANSEKGYNTLATILKNAGVPCKDIQVNVDEVFFLRDNELTFPKISKEKLRKEGDGWAMDIYVFSPRPLDDLLIEPNMPKLTLNVKASDCALAVNDKPFAAANQTRNEATFKELPLLQGWNKVSLKIADKDKNEFTGFFKCDNRSDFMPLLKAGFTNPEKK